MSDQTEVQRLRAALERIVTVYEECDCTAKDLYLIAVNEVGSKQPKVANEVHEALSTTTEPTNAAKVKRIECPCCGCEISINAPEGDGNDA